MSISSLPEALSVNTMAQSNITSSNTNERPLTPIDKKRLMLDPSFSVQTKQQHVGASTKTEQQAQVKLLAEKLDRFLSTLDKGISFRLDEKSGKQVVTIYEMSTGNVIKQYPEEKMLKIAQRLADHVGTFVDEKI